MNEQTEQNMNEAIDWLQSVGERIEGFTLEQMPLYCQEVLAWKVALNVTWLILFGVLLVVSLVLVAKGVPKWKAKYRDKIKARNEYECTGLHSDAKRYRIASEREESAAGCWIAPAGFALFVSFGIVICTFNLVKIKTAPRVVIMEHLTSKLK